MIATDSSSLVAFFADLPGGDVELLAHALAQGSLILPPPVTSEVCSYPARTASEIDLVARAALMPLSDGYWLRAGETRRLLLSKGLKARLADSLIAQCCIDTDTPLITRDPDFRHFAQWCGLKLV